MWVRNAHAQSNYMRMRKAMLYIAMYEKELSYLFVTLYKHFNKIALGVQQLSMVTT